MKRNMTPLAVSGRRLLLLFCALFLLSFRCNNAAAAAAAAERQKDVVAVKRHYEDNSAAPHGRHHHRDRDASNHRHIHHQHYSVQRRQLQQEYNLTLYAYSVTATYGFVLNETTAALLPDPPVTLIEVDNLARLTEIYYKRSIASMFSQTYQDFRLTTDSNAGYVWQPSSTSSTSLLRVDFDAIVTLRHVMEPIPDENQVLNVLLDINTNSDTYIRNFVKIAVPQDLFLRTTSTEIVAALKSSGTPPPTSAPVAYTNAPLTGNEQEFPMTATAPPTPSATTTPTLSGSAQNDQQEGEPGVYYSTPAKSGENENKPKSPSATDDGASSNGDTPATNDDAIDGPSEIIDFGSNAHWWMTAVMAEELTAANMFYWMAAAWAMHLGTGVALSKWSRAYRRSEAKKWHLTSYWVQLVFHPPVVAILAWVTAKLRDHEDHHAQCVATGLRVFSHVAMLLLALHGMELFYLGGGVRGGGPCHSRSKILIVHRIIVIAVMLYVISGKDSDLIHPLDQVMFGVIEAFGAFTEQPSCVTMIYYRRWSDSSSPQEKERVGPRVSSVMCLSICLSWLLKLGLIVVSLIWYILQWDDLADSNLIWLVPLLRVVQTAVLVRSFYIQQALFQTVTAAVVDDDDSAAAERRMTKQEIISVNSSVTCDNNEGTATQQDDIIDETSQQEENIHAVYF